NSAVLKYYIYDNNSASSGCAKYTRVRHMANDPSVLQFVAADNQTRLADIRDGDIYGDGNTAVLDAGTGWRTLNLTSNMSYLQAQLVPNWFAAGINTYAGANGHNTCRNWIRGYSNANKPQLIVNYDPPQTTETITICSNQLPYTWNGQVIQAGGTAVATHTSLNANG